MNSAPVNEPKNGGVPGANVATSAPHNKGTTIMPPGTASIARLMGTCIILPRVGPDGPLPATITPGAVRQRGPTRWPATGETPLRR